MSLKEYIGGQCAYPEGVGGAVISKGMNILNTSHYKAVKKFVCKDKNAKILDIGFGNGYLLKKLSKELDAKLYGIDVSYDMLRKAGHKNDDAVTLNRVILRQGYASELPYNDNFFDTIYTVNTIYFWEDISKAFEEIFRVLKDGGNFICTFYSKEFLDKLPYCDSGFNKFTPSVVRSLAREFGFCNVKVKILKEDKAFCLIGEKNLDLD